MGSHANGFGCALLGVLLWASSVYAAPRKTLAADVAVGVPEVVALRAQFFAFSRVQFGLGYTLIPRNNLLGKRMELDPQNVTLGDNRVYTLEPSVTPTAIAVSPFLRYFPNDEDNFYFQLNYNLIRLTGAMTSGLQDAELSQELTGALVTGNVVFTQALPSVFIGHIFQSETFFFNIALGVTWLASLKSDVQLTGVLPDQVGGTAANDAALASVKAELQRSADEFAAKLRNSLNILPSISISFGIQF